MKKTIIVNSAMFAIGFFGIWALKQVGITPIGEDGEINWLLMVSLLVSFFVLASLLGKLVNKLTGEARD
jgi:hypothetical protein